MFLVAAILVGLFALYLTFHSLQPLAESSAVSSEDWARIDDESTALLSKKDVLVDELRDLEFEAAMNKVDADDLVRMRGRYEVQAVALMEEIDARARAFDGRIEADVQRILTRAKAKREGTAQTSVSYDEDHDHGDAPPNAAGAASDSAPSSTVGEATTALEEPREVEPQPKDGDIAPGEQSVEEECPDCGVLLALGSKFCDGCGTKVVAQCSGCGTANRVAARFCKSCGETLGDAQP